MLISAAVEASCSQISNGSFQTYEAMEEMLISSSPPPGTGLFYNLSVLRDKLDQVEAMVSIMLSLQDPPIHRDSAAAAAAAGAAILVQDLIVAASSLVFAFQQLASAAAPTADVDENEISRSRGHGKVFDCGEAMDHTAAGANVVGVGDYVSKIEFHDVPFPPSPPMAAAACDVIEIDVADLLAKYTHYCHVCGKGFKRDANLRMHMRAHGDEYKTNAALSNPTKSAGGDGAGFMGGARDQFSSTPRKKYSCPQEGCRWNRKHAKFQPLKSMVCVKNHYRRSHCPKMYVCNRCSRKQFSVLSDLRTHEKHCGDLKWRCSCGTTFSRKDKLMGHVAMFVGHAPVVESAYGGGGGGGSGIS